MKPFNKNGLILIINFSDDSQKYESTIFPFILSQLTKSDIEAFESLNSEYYKYSVGNIHPPIVKDNLLRLGLIEDHFGAISDEPIGKKYRKTEFGIQFYECCSNNRNDNGVN